MPAAAPTSTKADGSAAAVPEAHRSYLRRRLRPWIPVLALSPHAAHITAAERDAAALSVLRQELDARGITNVTPLCADVLAYTPPVPFDAMVFCFFGSMEEILAAALRQCRGTVLAVVRDDVCHRFSGAPRAPEPP